MATLLYHNKLNSCPSNDTSWQQQTCTNCNLYPHCLKLKPAQTTLLRFVTGSPAQVGEDHLKEEDAHAVHVELVWVVEAPQDGGQKGCHGQGGRPGGLHAANSCKNNVWAFLLIKS